MLAQITGMALKSAGPLLQSVGDGVQPSKVGCTRINLRGKARYSAHTETYVAIGVPHNESDSALVFHIR